jgi:hypothetical protein
MAGKLIEYPFDTVKVCPTLKIYSVAGAAADSAGRKTTSVSWTSRLLPSDLPA